MALALGMAMAKALAKALAMALALGMAMAMTMAMSMAKALTNEAAPCSATASRQSLADKCMIYAEPLTRSVEQRSLEQARGQVFVDLWGQGVPTQRWRRNYFSIAPDAPARMCIRPACVSGVDPCRL